MRLIKRVRVLKRYHAVFLWGEGLSLLVIVYNLLCTLLESINSIGANYASFFYYNEIACTLFFVFELALRILLNPKRKRYLLSFVGLIDILATLPSAVFLFSGRGHSLLFLRVVRLLRIFRVLKLFAYLKEGRIMLNRVSNNVRNYVIFAALVLVLVFILGSLMYVIEGEENGFTSIPQSIYWAIVTITTVGYGDISPQTPMGKLLASVVMLLGYVMLAVPLGNAITRSVKKAEGSEKES